MSLPLRAAVAVGCLLLGAATGIAAVAVHQHWWGLLLGLTATAATLVALPGGWWRRLPFAAAWSVVVVVLAVERAEGDYLVLANVRGYVVLGAAFAVIVCGMVDIRERRTAGASAVDSGRAGSPT